MKKTSIGRKFEKDILEVTYDNSNMYKDDLQIIVDVICRTVNQKEINKEERKELYEIYAEVISNISFIHNKLEAIEKEINNIENLEETELKND